MQTHFKWALLLPILVLFACSPKTNPIGGQYKIHPKQENEIVDALTKINAKSPKYFFAKTDTKYQSSKNNYSFKTSIRMAKDSALNAFITYAKFPIITAQLNKDSIFIINRREKCFIIQDLDYIKSNFGVDFSFENIEQLFLGQALGFDIENEFDILPDPYTHILSTKNKKAGKNGETIIINYHLNNDLLTLKKVEIITDNKATVVSIDYSNYQEIESYLIPKNIQIEIKTAGNTDLISLVYETIELNVPRELSLVIPENYVSCK